MNKEINFPDGTKVVLVAADKEPQPGEIDTEIVDAVRVVIKHFPGTKTTGSLKIVI